MKSEEEDKIVKRPASTLYDEMNRCHETGRHRKAVIVFSQSNWAQPYSEKSRSYISHSDQWGWNYNMSGEARLADCLDGTDTNIRLDWVDWVIEYWYWAD